MNVEASRNRRHAGAVLALVLVFAFAFTGVAAAQGTQTGTLSGGVKSADGAPLPGVAVTLKSPAIQGERTGVTDSTGGFIFRGLPPGQGDSVYTLTFTLTGFGTVSKKVGVALGGNPDVDVTMTVASVQESVEVTAEAPSMLSTTQLGANLQAAQVDKLASPRTLQGIATLSPGVSDDFRTPNAGQLSISGSFAYDNVFLLNGVDINDNLFGTANNLFIEDAIQEVQVLTNGVSAEFGRFSGGVVNAVTKRGGNKFAGSFRMDFTNPKWMDESRFEQSQIDAGVAGAKPHADKFSHPYQATLGGPIIKDKVWFFVAGRRQVSEETRSLAVTGGSYDFGTVNNRIEAKLTGSITPNHTLQADYIRQPVENTNLASINTTFSIDDKTLIDRQNPNDLFVANYNGVLSSNLFVEAQYSRKTFGFRNSGSSFTDIHQSPFLGQGRNGIPANSHYNAPYFDNADPEDRNNHQYTAALSYFLSTGSMGRHDLKFGGEYFTSLRTGGNSQSSTGYVFQTDPLAIGGVVQRDGSGNIIPTFTSGVSRIQNWLPVRGAEIDLHTTSIYVNDRWQLNNHWTFNLGARYENYNPDATQAGIQSPKSSALVPRLGVTYDVKADGKWILQATYGHYAGKQSETQFADNTNVGNPNLIVLQYAGPSGAGVNFAPGFDLNNYAVIGGSFPVNNVVLDSGLKTPITKEWTLQAGTRLGRKGEIKLAYAQRRTTNFLDDFINDPSAAGKTTVTQDGRTFGTFDNSFITNTDIPERQYKALDGIFSYRITDKWSVNANYTHQFLNDGNFTGEAANQPGNYSIIGDYPEFYTEARHYPVGHLPQYEADRLRAFSTYDFSLGGFGRASLGVLYRFDSPGAFSYIATSVPVSAIQRAKNPGYATPPTLNNNLFFGDRGIGRFEKSHLFDFAVTYEVPVWKTARPWFKLELRNAFNAQPLIQFNTTISVDPNSPVDSLGLPTGYIKGANFGKDTSNLHTPIPQEFRVSLGFRF